MGLLTPGDRNFSAPYNLTEPLSHMWSTVHPNAIVWPVAGVWNLKQVTLIETAERWFLSAGGGDGDT